MIDVVKLRVTALEKQRAAMLQQMQELQLQIEQANAVVHTLNGGIAALKGLLSLEKTDAAE